MGEINSYVSGNEVLLARICVPIDENMAIFCPIMNEKKAFYLFCSQEISLKQNYVILSANFSSNRRKQNI